VRILAALCTRRRARSVDVRARVGRHARVAEAAKDAIGERAARRVAEAAVDLLAALLLRTHVARGIVARLFDERARGRIVVGARIGAAGAVRLGRRRSIGAAAVGRRCRRRLVVGARSEGDDAAGRNGEGEERMADVHARRIAQSARDRSFRPLHRDGGIPSWRAECPSCALCMYEAYGVQ